jgi:hypothetical protein
MTVRVKVRNNRQIIVPLRFARAVTGPPVVDASEVDDRGFAMGVRPGTWGTTDTRGAMVSVTEGDTIRVKVLREDIDDTAQLFVTSTDPSAADIDGSAGPLPADGVFRLRGVRDSKNVPVKIQVHLGAIGGPVLGELEPHIFQLRQLRVRAHIVTINGTASARTAAGLAPLFAAVNVIWRAAGIEFLYVEAQTRNGSINGFATAGTVTTNLGAGQFAEFSRVLNLRDPPNDPGPDPNAVNVYFVQNSSDPASNWTGLTLDRDSPRPGGFGVVLLDRGNAHELAHELGHFLDLDLHAGENAAGTHIRDDVFSERRMMFDFSPLDANQPAHRNDVGYGNLIPGELIDVKDFTADATDGSVARSRRRSLNPF